MKWSRFVLSLGAAMMCGCGSDAVTSNTGSLAVSVSTDGEGTDDDGYVLDLDSGSSTTAVDVDGSVTLTVEEGTHTLELTEVAGACSVTSDNPVSVSVAADQTSTVEFAVTCEAG
jgi:hypothetical protein